MDTALYSVDTNPVASTYVMFGSGAINADSNSSYDTAPVNAPGTHSLNTQIPAIPVVAPAKYEAFERALRAYVDDRLSDDAKKDFRSASDIMETLQRMQYHQSGPASKIRISSSVSARVNKVLQSLRNFMESVTICIQHSPEISSLVIGGVNCILTVRTRIPTGAWNC